MIQLYGTMGPNCQTKDVFTSMLMEGMAGIRLNLSHSSLEKSRSTIEAYSEACRSLHVPMKLMIDMHGPEQRTGSREKPLLMQQEEEVLLTNDPCGPSSCAISVSPLILNSIELHDHVLLQDGLIELEVIQKKPRSPAGIDTLSFQCKVLHGGILHSHQSVKICSKEVYGPLLTQEDLHNLDLARQAGVTAVMQPFVRRGEDIRAVRSALQERHIQADIFAKIESREGIEHLDSIIQYADVIVIARGDLGNSMPLWELPAAQKKIAAQCIAAHRPFMVVTQLLHSMIHSPVPTRAEVSDIYNSVLDGASYLMVTGETSVGQYPVQVMHYLSKTVEEAEKHQALI